MKCPITLLVGNNCCICTEAYVCMYFYLLYAQNSSHSCFLHLKSSVGDLPAGVLSICGLSAGVVPCNQFNTFANQEDNTASGEGSH